MPTRPVPLIKRGANLAGCLGSILFAGPPSRGAVSGTGQALQGGTIPDGAMPINNTINIKNFSSPFLPRFTFFSKLEFIIYVLTS